MTEPCAVTGTIADDPVVTAWQQHAQTLEWLLEMTRDRLDSALFLLAEARHVAAEWRADAWDYCRTPEDPVEPVPGEDIMPMPWEVTL